MPYATAEDLRAAAGAFAAAPDRAAARSAAADLAWVAVDDAVAVSPLAAEVVSTARRLVEDGFRWRADAFAVVIHALDHDHVWRDLRAQVRTYRGQYDESIAREQAVAEALQGFDGRVRDLLADPDPETRSLAALLLTRISPEPEADRELLLLLAGADNDDLARGCLGRAILSLGEDGALELLADPSPVTRYRIAHHPWELADSAGRARVLEILGETPLPWESWNWPAEVF
ncbi:hypothetical protein [Actinoplanes friuliensis]|uniref:HEAT repeat domain-containing protein n=1 Tax=Actinoplanes friuliensis DSM 7358 TaxID=1246995 RepID=U5WA23_9ACTN|nr:hypothetical protein [Actinoplanes friuliensis]AGZ45872.1 hypothetical protein AFR_38090 [Actinoplanes friuliensis DSM 7358]